MGIIFKSLPLSCFQPAYYMPVACTYLSYYNTSTMAKLVSEIQFTGSVGNLTVYKRRDSDQLIVRKKGGASKKRIKTDPQYINTRRVNAEFGGRSTAGKWIRRAMLAIEHIGNEPVAGGLTRLLLPVQKMDQTSEWGRRAVALSSYPQLMNGYSLSKKNSFDSIIRNPINYSLNKTTNTAEIQIPALIPGINFFASAFHPLFRIELALGIVPDVFYDPVFKKYIPKGEYNQIHAVDTFTEWYPISKGSPATSLTLKCPAVPVDSPYSLMLTIGFRYGTVGEGNIFHIVKYQGAGKILGAI